MKYSPENLFLEPLIKKCNDEKDCSCFNLINDPDGREGAGC